MLTEQQQTVKLKKSKEEALKMVTLCLWCKHFLLSFGTDDYSELTPGNPPECQCYKGHWCLDRYSFTMKDYRIGMLKAQTCLDFERSDE